MRGQHSKRIIGEPRPRGQGPITVTVRGDLAEKIRDLSLVCRSASAAHWCLEALEFMLLEHRAGKYRPTPSEQYGDRNGNGFSHVVDEDV